MMKTGKQYSNNKTKAVPIIDTVFFLYPTKQTAALGLNRARLPQEGELYLNLSVCLNFFAVFFACEVALE